MLMKIKMWFYIVCCKCGMEGWIMPIHSYANEDYKNTVKITLELRYSCGNRYGTTIHEI